MINTIIFSENNPGRLRILLQSIRNNHVNDFNFNVLHRSFNSDYEPLYEKLKTEFSDLNINWTGYSDFKEAVLRLLQKNSELSMFLRDDDVFYNPENFKSINQIMESEQDVLCFSLRLGKNTKLCRNMNTANNFVISSEINGGQAIKWDWTKNYLDYGFPFSTEGHVFRTKELLKMLKQVAFKNPDQIEENLTEVFEFFPRKEMCSFVNSILVKDIAGPDQKQINEMYVNEKPINIEEMDFSNVDGCCAYIPKPSREVNTIEKTETNA
jgi:hypothetical protein